MFSRRDRAPSVVAEVFAKFAAQRRCPPDSDDTDMEQAAGEVVRQAVQEGNGLGFLPAGLRNALAAIMPSSGPLPAMRIGSAFPSYYSDRPPVAAPKSRGSRSARRPPMPFAKDFSAVAAESQRRAEEEQRRTDTRAEDVRRSADERRRAAEGTSRHRKGARDPFGSGWPPNRGGAWSEQTKAPTDEGAERRAHAYATLGLGGDATLDDVKRRHHELALQHHSDLQQGTGSDERIKAVNAAADILKRHLRR